MSYLEYEFTIFPTNPGKEILLAELMQFNFDSFIETETTLKAYIKNSKIDFDITTLSLFSNQNFKVSFIKRKIKENSLLVSSARTNQI